MACVADSAVQGAQFFIGIAAAMLVILVMIPESMSPRKKRGPWDPKK